MKNFTAHIIHNLEIIDKKQDFTSKANTDKYVRVCVCVKDRERGREKERERDKEREREREREGENPRRTVYVIILTCNSKLCKS